ncbi:MULTISPECIES: phasin family protein [unclassified Undibacterium]|uniref:phasin family protein n=1 Tax=unclassified Undibacterium TaxID=2630295 RepID=UPI002AC96A6F|nr:MULTISPECIES: phasin family protein [unclassified Undibacterium]MEB0137544.1 phasin family protein [Undibacterium sp. CCC2.1]MEB0170545.1 phasin family protein [Undibacterium sp. CCC1.1]MEB0174486.1 phasin family protein [Undibacterium sp. CCC3.4]MEB0213717.1 phasin family protein [Undibacterium sp. 5I2]WPX43882.1 phasin family protein [Undibacterium sp. CCC3.4]
MFSVPEQFSAASKANIDAQIALFSSLSGKIFEGVEKIVELNVNLVKHSFEESAASTKQLLAAKDPQEFFSLSTAQSQPGAEKLLSYGRQLAAIATDTQTEFKLAAETQLTEHHRKIRSLFDDVSKSAPAGSEQFVSFFKTAIDQANAGYEQLNLSTKQAVAAIEANLNNTVAQISQVTEKAAPRATKK